MTTQPRLGISLSGGGLRAAAFGLGCLQALDDKHGVLEGPHAADCLAAVSGGSYTAASVSLYVTSQQESDLERGAERAFAPGSAEADMLAARSNYFLRDGFFALFDDVTHLVGYGFAALACSILWLPTVVAFLGWSMPFLAPKSDVALIPLGLVGLALYLFGFRFLVIAEPRGAPKPWPSILTALILVGFAPSTYALVRELPFVDRPSWWWDHRLACAATLALAVLVFSGWFALRWSNGEARRTIGRVLLSASLEVLYRLLQTTALYAALVYVAYVPTSTWAGPIIAILVFLIAGPVLFAAASDAVSPHHYYSTKVASCFGLTAPMDDPVPVEVLVDLPLSALRPPTGTTVSRRRPELVVCAAANLGHGVPPASSLTFSPEHLVLHHPDGTVAVATHLYEALTITSRQTPQYQRPALGLFRSVGLSGAAIAPTMGYLSVRALEGIIALLNLRLGRWMPNPANAVVAGLLGQPGPHPMQPGVREAFREVFGWHPSSSFWMYVTDGGHYENLGIVELLRRRCRTIIAVDSSGGRPWGALEHSLRLARHELGIRVDFPAGAGPSDATLGPDRLWAVGTVGYPGGDEGQVLVVRIGTNADTPAEVQERGRSARRFPHTPTGDQFFTAESFQAYVDLGRWAMSDALESDEVSRWRLPLRIRPA